MPMRKAVTILLVLVGAALVGGGLYLAQSSSLLLTQSKCFASVSACEKMDESQLLQYRAGIIILIVGATMVSLGGFRLMKRGRQHEP